MARELRASYLVYVLVILHRRKYELSRSVWRCLYQNKVRGACGMCKENEKYKNKFWLESVIKRDHLGDQVTDGRMV